MLQGWLTLLLSSNLQRVYIGGNNTRTVPFVGMSIGSQHVWEVRLVVTFTRRSGNVPFTRVIMLLRSVIDWFVLQQVANHLRPVRRASTQVSDAIRDSQWTERPLHSAGLWDRLR